MLLQFVSNAFLMFAWGQIRNDLNKDSVVNDVVTTMQVDARELFLMAIKQEGTAFKNAMQKQSIWQNPNGNKSAKNATVNETKPLQIAYKTENGNGNETHETQTTESVGNGNNETETVQTIVNETENGNEKTIETREIQTVITIETKRYCKNCGTELPKNATSRRVFCSDNCRMAAANFKLRNN